MNRGYLLKVSKPSRYTGGEVNSVVKDLNRVRLKFALAFPDVYEVGMSYQGMQVLYQILNREPDIACERVFAPWPDMEQILRSGSLTLTSLESCRPLKGFDILGFSLLYELNYTGVLNILDLSGIPLLASEREEEDPLVIGGGPCAMNPEPLADFFDAFVLGDGEEVILEICREVMASRESGESKRALLERLSRLEGVYIPSFFQVGYEPSGQVREIIPLRDDYRMVRRRVLPDLDSAFLPSRPILPFMEVIHDRLNIEIARGCTRGCRFCQAGLIYRPLRERSPQKILQWMEEGLRATGYDEVSLLSLSAGDYSCIAPLLTALMGRYREERVALSLPSMRIETLTPALIDQIQQVRRTGFTLAPEAGTERLRQVINKGNTEENLLSTIQAVFSAGWRLIKLYFMIGLPTELEQDLEGIVQLCRKSLKVARRNRGSAQINVSISTFIPKAHTPFQWEPMSSQEAVLQKQMFLRHGLDRQGLRIKWSDFRLSLLEAAFARGDRRLGKVLKTAYQIGCRLDGWSDHLRYELWEEAFSRSGLDHAFYAYRPKGIEEILPWSHLDSRVGRQFLQEEREKAFQAIPTTDCQSGPCTNCGVCGGELKNRKSREPEISLTAFPALAKKSPALQARFRSRFAKFGSAKFMGHLELCQALLRAFRRARIPLLFSQGFHPLPRVSFGPPLPVGYESRAEFIDFQVEGGLSPEEATRRLSEVLPPGIAVLETQEIPLKYPSIFDNIIEVFYKIRFSGSYRPPRDKIEKFMEAASTEYFWARKKKSLDLKGVVKSLLLEEDGRLELVMRAAADGNVRPEEVLDFIFGWKEEERPSFSIEKARVQFRG